MPVKLSGRRQLGMAGEVAGVIRVAFAAGEISSLFGLEGVLRAALRSDLCLRGWRWIEAHQAATDIVGGAHSLLGAERPDWYEGQPDYVIAEGVLIERTRCKRCHKSLPENRHKFCCDLCRTSHHNLLARIRAAQGEAAADLEIRSMY